MNSTYEKNSGITENDVEELWRLIIAEVERLNDNYNRIESRLAILRGIFWCSAVLAVVAILLVNPFYNIITGSFNNVPERRVILLAIPTAFAYAGIIYSIISLNRVRRYEGLLHRKVLMIREAEAEYIGETAHSGISSVEKYYRHLRRAPVIDLIYRADYIKNQLSSPLRAFIF